MRIQKIYVHTPDAHPVPPGQTAAELAEMLRNDYAAGALPLPAELNILPAYFAAFEPYRDFRDARYALEAHQQQLMSQVMFDFCVSQEFDVPLLKAVAYLAYRMINSCSQLGGVRAAALAIWCERFATHPAFGRYLHRWVCNGKPV